MPTITLDETFWATLLLTAHQLYRFAYDDGKEKSLECLGMCWGLRTGDNFRLVYAAATQIVKARDESSVQGHDQFDFHVHVAWSGMEVGDLNAIGEFHSHPYSEKEVLALRAAGQSEDIMWTASAADHESMAVDMIEVIVSLQPLTLVARDRHLWAQRGLVVAGKHDLAYVTISGWYKDAGEVVSQVQVLLPAANTINDRIRAYDARSGAGGDAR
jgi:hypothetical protein